MHATPTERVRPGKQVHDHMTGTVFSTLRVCSFIHSLNKYQLGTRYVPITVLRCWECRRTKESLCLHGTYILKRETCNEHNKKIDDVVESGTGSRSERGLRSSPKMGPVKFTRVLRACFLSLWPGTDELGYLRSEK